MLDPSCHATKHTFWVEHRKFRGVVHSLKFERSRQASSEARPSLWLLTVLGYFHCALSQDGPGPVQVPHSFLNPGGTSFVNLVTPGTVTSPLHIHHVPCDLGYLGDCALFQETHSHTLSLPRLREISRPDQVTLSQVQTDSWGGDPGGGCSYHLSPPTDFPLTQDIPRPLSRLDQFFYSLSTNLPTN